MAWYREQYLEKARLPEAQEKLAIGKQNSNMMIDYSENRAKPFRDVTGKRIP